MILATLYCVVVCASVKSKIYGTEFPAHLAWVFLSEFLSLPNVVKQSLDTRVGAWVWIWNTRMLERRELHDEASE